MMRRMAQGRPCDALGVRRGLRGLDPALASYAATMTPVCGGMHWCRAFVVLCHHDDVGVSLRLARVRQVARGLHHMHTQGVLHQVT